MSPGLNVSGNLFLARALYIFGLRCLALLLTFQNVEYHVSNPLYLAGGRLKHYCFIILAILRYNRLDLSN